MKKYLFLFLILSFSSCSQPGESEKQGSGEPQINGTSTQQELQVLEGITSNQENVGETSGNF